MKITDKDISMINNYLLGQLPNKENEVFQEKLKSEIFRSTLMERAAIIDALDIYDEETIKKGFESLEKNSHDDKPVTRNSKSFPTKKLLISILIASFLIISATYFFNKTSDNINPKYDNLIDKYQSIYPPQYVERSQNNTTISEELRDGLVDYAEGNYKDALLSLESIKFSSDEIQIYIANCHIELNNYTAAKQVLNNIPASNSLKISENKDWYLIICELGLENKSEALNKLETIAGNSSHRFGNKANALIKDLKK